MNRKRYVPVVGPKLRKPLEKLGLTRVRDVAYHLPDRFVKRMSRMTPSLSAVIVFLGTSLDMESLDVGI